MNKIFITGDCHGADHLQKMNDFAIQNPELDKSDVMIITGDFGVIWKAEEDSQERDIMRWAQNLPFSLFVVLGSHENYNRIEKLPTIKMYDGSVWQDPRYPQIVYAQSGNIYNINNKSFFCFNGGMTIDKECRKEWVSWWPQELPTVEQMNYGLENLKKVNNTVDFIVTHDCPVSGFKYIPQSHKCSNYDKYISHLNHYLEKVFNTTNIKRWYCGRFHCDSGDMKITFMFNTVKEILL
jgi:hypothetical protein